MRNKERLERLAEFVETLPGGKLHMRRWAVVKDEEFARDVLGPKTGMRRERLESDEAEALGIPDADGIYLLRTSDVVTIAGREKGMESPSCHTAMCLAGWTCYLWPEEVNPELDFQDNARAILGLDIYESDKMFWNMDLNPTTAAAELRRLASLETGGTE